ncbi:MAG: hypothetical protein Q7R97_00210 [Candidatus Daviesbacteria bacterium]|nr:hypothetical protein [Candidatus Daviesbacteria bacterium]
MANYPNKVRSKVNRQIILRVLKIIPLIGILFLSVYLFYLSFTYKDILYSSLGLIVIILAVTFSGKLGIFNRQISLTFHKTLFEGVRDFRKFKVSAVKIEKDGMMSLIKRWEYRLLLLICLGYILIRSLISNLYTINILEVSQITTGNQQVFQLYLTAVWQQFSRVWVYELIPLIVAFIVSIILFTVRNQRKRKILNPSNSIGFGVISLIVLVILYFVSVFITLQYSKFLTYSNIDSITSKINSSNGAKSLNILADNKEIIENLRKSENMPNIIGNSDKLSEAILLSVMLNQVKSISFYQQVILPSAISDKKVVLKLPNDILLLPNGTLVIKELNKAPIEAMSPVLGRLMVRKYFDSKYVKEEPQIQVMGRQEYLKFREDQINEQLAEIDKYITNTQTLINAAYANISEDKQKIESNKNGLSNSISSKDSDYNKCKTAGYYSYYFGTFSRYYTDSECDARRAQWDQIIAGFQKNINDWEQSLKTDQYNLGEYQKAKDLLVKYQGLVASQKDTTPGELGIFESPDKIKVVLESTSDRAIADYFAIVVHEYLHYTSYVSEERQLPQFFEEGLTEYYARQIVSKEIKTETNVGYPAIIPIIKKIAQDLPKGELERIYFTKDEKSLIALLNDKYGDSFYKDSEYYFKIIPFLGGSDTLEIVNNILFKIGAPQLTEKDLYSESSKFGNSISK